MTDPVTSMRLVRAYGAASVLLLLYSFTQTDLNLTISRVGFWQAVQRGFQSIGYFHRPLSTVLFLALLVIYFALYAFTIRGVASKAIGAASVWKIILLNAAILVLAYPAFSHDIFNYLFTARTVALYQQNPYAVRPIDFAGIDPWTAFMRWTHLPSAYTPLWIAMTVPLSILGLQYFLPTLFLFKAMLTGFYLLCAYLIWRILSAAGGGDRATVGLVLFALNPLVLIESVVSPHNDIVMAAFAVAAVYFGMRRRMWESFLLLSASVAAKLMTLALVPIYLYKLDLRLALWLMSAAAMAAFARKELLPWYFLWVMPFVALARVRGELLTLYIAVSAGLLLRYAPFLYYGEYHTTMDRWRTAAFLIPIAVWLCVTACGKFAGRRTG